MRSGSMTIRILLLTGAALAAAAAPAQASCVPMTQAERERLADAVFTGRVVSVSANGASARFRVLRVSKGIIRKGAVVRVAAEPYPSSVTMRWNPRPGQRWRVGAQRRGTRWVTSDCLGTRRL